MALTEKELDEASETLRQTLKDIRNEDIQEHHDTLHKMQLEGRKAMDTIVQDRELRLIESERKYTEKMNDAFNGMRDTVRQLEGEIAKSRLEIERLGGAAELRPGDRGYNPDYKGCFIPDVAKFREFIRAKSGYYGQNQSTRGLDPGIRVGEGRDAAGLAPGLHRVSDLSSAMLTASTDQGLLPPDVADTFIDNLISQQPSLSVVTTRRMNSPTAYLDELIVAARKLALAVEATAPSNTQAFSAVRRQLDSVEYIWTEDITLSFLEDNIEKRNAEAHVANMIARQFGNDLNDLGWNGDVDDGGGEKAFLNLNDGWGLLATDASDEVVYTATSDLSSTAVMAGMYKVVPVAVMARPDLRFFMPIPFVLHYADEVAARGTALGDQTLQGGLPNMRYFGVPITADPHLSSANSSKAKGYLTPASNLVFGVQRQITVDSMWQPRKRVIEYTVTARCDYQIAAPRFVVRTQTIPSALQ